ncbi:NUDIX hydrolase [Psychrobacillus sp. FJAT-51614]|uniref:NUDIX hydrolase n=1 Tax=Psychrobacillus mangrovi TaxID=3117745 RepID=A0ABU8F5F8_9BACI
MENEMLRIFDENRLEIGTATREEVHRLGLWHETFHCWFISRKEGKEYIYLQIRSDHKKDYPSLLDITAAGHLLATEKVVDGIREVQEELGIEVTFDEFVSLGVIDYSITTGELIDKELANVFMYNNNINFEDFNLQVEEVSGIVRADFKQFAALWTNEVSSIEIEGYQLNDFGERIPLIKIVEKDAFVPHENSYYKAVISGIQAILCP